MSPALETMGGRVMDALCNGTYQGILVVIVLVLTLACFRRLNATTRYAINFLVLLYLAALPIVHLALPSRSYPPKPSPKVPSAVAPAPALGGEGVTPTIPKEAPLRLRYPVLLVRTERTSLSANTGTEEVPGSASEVAWTTEWLAVSEAEDSSATEGDAQPSSSSQPGEADGEDATAAFAPGLPPAWNIERGGFPRGSSDPSPEEGSAELQAGAGPAWFPWEPFIPARLSLWLVLAWLGLATCRWMALAGQYITLHRLTRRAEAPPAHLAGMLEEVRGLCGVTRKTKLCLSTEVTSPLVTGLVSPRIVFPTRLAAAPAADVERILRHELAHLRRWDDWTNLIQQVIRAVYFFHPGVLWLCRRLTVDREIACDDHVLSAVRSHREYALFLTNFASRTQGRHWTAAPAAWSRKSQLKERIEMILDTKRNASTSLARARLGALGTAAAVIAGLGLYLAPRMVLAETSPDQPTPPAPPLTTDEVKVKDAAPEAPADAIHPEVPRLAAPVVHVATQPAVIRAPATIALPPSPSVTISGVDPALDISGPKFHWTPVASTERGDDLERRLERRLERLEKLVESLVEGKGPARTAGRIGMEAGDAKRKDGDKPGKEIKGGGDIHASISESVKHALAEAGKEVARATREAERAVKEATRSSAFGFKAGPGPMAKPGPGEPFEAQRKALSEQRRALQKQLEKVEQQLEKMKEQFAEQREQQREREQELRDREHEKRERLREERERNREQNDNQNENENSDSSDGREDGPKAKPNPKY